MSRLLPIAAGFLVSLGACTPVPRDQFVASQKSPVELRAMQTRLVAGDDNSAMRSVIATLHGLGYRITRAETEAGTVSGTRSAVLRMAVVVRPAAAGQSIVRANATVLGFGNEAQVDDPELYADNFFRALAEVMGRQPLEAPVSDTIPDAVRPVAEVNSAADRKAAVKPTKAETKP